MSEQTCARKKKPFFLECLFSPFYWQSFLPPGMEKKVFKMSSTIFTEQSDRVNLELKGDKSVTGTIQQKNSIWKHNSVPCANLLDTIHSSVESRNTYELENPQISFAFIIFKTNIGNQSLKKLGYPWVEHLQYWPEWHQILKLLWRCFTILT